MGKYKKLVQRKRRNPKEGLWIMLLEDRDWLHEEIVIID